MTTELIVNLVCSLLGTGGLLALFLIAEKKAAAQIENSDKINEQWQKIIKQKERDIESLNSKYETAVEKISRLYDDNSELRNRLDSANTECAVSRLLRCENIECPNRKPPMTDHTDLITPANS